MALASAEKLLAELGAVSRLKGGYDARLGAQLYQNHLPVDAQGHPKLPPNAVVALVNLECDHCHSFMVGAHYPTATADGRPILYLDRDPHSPNHAASAAYFKALGLSGDSGKGVLETGFGQLRLNKEPVRLPNGDEVAQGLFPILLNANAAGKVTGALSAGVIDSIAAVTTPNAGHARSQEAGNEAPKPLTQPQQDLIERAIYGIVIAHKGHHYAFQKGFNGGHTPNSKEAEQKIDDLRAQYTADLQAEKPGTHEALLAFASRHGVPHSGAEAKRALDTIINFNGIECGCTIKAPPPPQEVNLNDILLPKTPKQAAGKTAVVHP